MLRRVCLLALLITGLTLADDRADYEHKKVDIQEQKRILNKYHSDRQYPQAIEQQKVVAKLADEALQIALNSAEIPNAPAWKYQADIMNEVGYADEALKAIDEYMKTPLLDRRGQMEGWKKRAQIYRRAKDFAKAKEATMKAFELADNPRDRFNLRRDIANADVRERQLTEATAEAKAMEMLLPEIEVDKAVQAQRDLEGLRVRIYRETGNAAAAREAKLKELELRKVLLDKELEDFDSKYPVDAMGTTK